jgi:hypothetical protein
MNPYYEDEDDYDEYYADPGYDPREEFDHPRYFEIPYDEYLGTYAEPREIIDYSGTIYSDGGPVIQGGIYSGRDVIINPPRNSSGGSTATLLIATGTATAATASLATWAYTRGECFTRCSLRRSTDVDRRLCFHTRQSDRWIPKIKQGWKGDCRGGCVES